MTLLIAGVLIWSLVHFFKRIAPAARVSVQNRLGEGPYRGGVSLLLGLSIILMVRGYRHTDFDALYTSLAGIGHLNNLLMLVALMLVGASASKGEMRSVTRHPMLSGVVVWAVAHLLVKGDMGSVVLFGGLGLWAIVQMLLINASEGSWVRPEPGPLSGDLKLAVIALVLFVIIAAIHIMLQHNPFLGTYP